MDVKNKQNLILYTGIGIGTIIFLSFAYYILRDDFSDNKEMQRPQKMKIDLPGRKTTLRVVPDKRSAIRDPLQ